MNNNSNIGNEKKWTTLFMNPKFKRIMQQE